MQEVLLGGRGGGGGGEETAVVVGAAEAKAGAMLGDEGECDGKSPEVVGDPAGGARIVVRAIGVEHGEGGVGFEFGQLDQGEAWRGEVLLLGGQEQAALRGVGQERQVGLLSDVVEDEQGGPGQAVEAVAQAGDAALGGEALGDVEEGAAEGGEIVLQVAAVGGVDPEDASRIIQRVQMGVLEGELGLAQAAEADEDDGGGGLEQEVDAGEGSSAADELVGAPEGEIGGGIGHGRRGRRQTGGRVGAAAVRPVEIDQGKLDTVLDGHFAQVVQVGRPYFERPQQVGVAAGEQDMAGVAAVHDALGDINARAGHVPSAIDVVPADDGAAMEADADRQERSCAERG